MNQRDKHEAVLALAPEAGGRKPRGRGHERRAEILAAAARMFVERGVATVSTRAIADALGISQTTLYVYFPTKDAIFEALCEQCFTALVAAFHAVQSGAGTPLEKLRAMMFAYVQFGLEHEDEYRITFMTPHTHKKEWQPDLPLEMQSAGMQCSLLLSEHVAAVARAGLLRFEPEVAAQAMWAAGHGLVSLLITMPQFPWCEQKTLIATAIDSFLHGVLHPTPAPH